MPYKEKETLKLYYSIGEVAEMFNVNTSLIRFWEKEFDIIKPKKNKKGNRMFTKEDVDNFHIIYHLVKEKGYTLEGAKNKLKQSKADTLAEVEIANTLHKFREFLVQLKNQI
jgi:DNA-binding transcriptional MerR regulator